jgi:hypothetical protein
MRENQGIIRRDASQLHLLGTFVANLFKSRRRLEVENLSLASAQYCPAAITAPSAAA